MPHELKPEELRRVFDPKKLGFESTDKLKPFTDIIGQQQVIAKLLDFA